MVLTVLNHGCSIQLHQSSQGYICNSLAIHYTQSVDINTRTSFRSVKHYIKLQHWILYQRHCVIRHHSGRGPSTNFRMQPSCRAGTGRVSWSVWEYWNKKRGKWWAQHSQTNQKLCAGHSIYTSILPLVRKKLAKWYAWSVLADRAVYNSAKSCTKHDLRAVFLPQKKPYAVLPKSAYPRSVVWELHQTVNRGAGQRRHGGGGVGSEVR